MSGEVMNNEVDQTGLHDAEIAAQRQVAAELDATIEALRSSKNPSAELNVLRKLNLPPAELRARLNAAFNVAINSQVYVETRTQEGADDEELVELQAQADVVSKLVARMGVENKTVEGNRSNKRKTISAEEHKLDQVEIFMDFFQTEDPARFRAVQRIAQVGYGLFNEKQSFARSIMEKPLIAQTASALALTALISLANNGSPAIAANEKTTTTPTQPGVDEKDVLARNVVKITQSKVNPVVKKVDVNPAPDTPTVKKVVTIKENKPKTIVQVQPEQQQQSQSPVTIREKKHKTLEIKTLPSPESKNNIKIIPPAPLAPPATSVEAAPAPTPEQQGPYQLNAEQNAIIDSLNLSPAKKDFLRQVAAGAIGLQQHGSKVNPEVVIAQAALESGWGQSGLTKQANNYFGMKAGADWKGRVISMPTEEANPDGSRYIVDATWPVFESAEDCFVEYAKFIERLPHFADALEHPNDPAAYVNALVNGNLKYATDPQYVQKILATINANRLTEIVGIAHKVQAEKVAADAAAAAETQRVAAAKAVEEEAAKKAQTISQPKGELAPVTTLHLPVPEGSPKSGQYPGHMGIDFAVRAGTPFYAMMGGTVEVRKFNVMNEPFCKKAFANLGRSMSEIVEPVQQEVRITRVIDGRTFVAVYAHMDSINVENGQVVEAGAELGTTGNTGCSLGDHAHVEMQVDNKGSVAPHLLMDGEKWKAPGSVISWATGIMPQSAESNHDHSEGDGHLHAHSATEVDADVEKVADGNESDNVESARVKVEAIKRLIELKKQAGGGQENSQPVETEGYLAIPR